VQYHVEVFTADKPGAGTDAKVYVQLFGARGDTGKRMLLKSLEEGDKFEAGKVGSFPFHVLNANVIGCDFSSIASKLKLLI
jgi:hypothetical protein